ncbi:GNAT family N-acetyltransferase [Microvirga rosea]|uniref:GNAT family N-acetyltransferase n=1 Tax=Microvirga rosea TaxID=2715425 RepID=UPI001D0A3712|nr:GNAT family N-acetyltransferase [Microvirga rosea]MCB8820349.1 GNAT family N-acetyltransferase [Microvirga rosea]
MKPEPSPSSHPAIDPNQIVIRAARSDDAEGINAMANLPGFRWGTLRMPHQPPEATRKWLESRAPGDLNLVAVLEGRIVASGGITSFPGRRAHAGMLGLGVHDDFQGRGIGTRMLREILAMADDWLGLKRVELTVYTDNGPAIALYERSGFEREGLHRNYAFRAGRFVDAYAMARLKV